MSDFYEEEFAREERMSRQDRDKRRNAHGGGAPAPAPAAPAELSLDTADLATLREALAAERRNRAWVESRLEELELRLRRAQAAERALQTSAAQDQVAVLGLAAGHTQELQKEADREALESWILEAQIRADAAEPQALVVAKQEPIVTVAEPVVVRETVVVREAYVDPHFEEKLASARLAVQAAEARAEHNAAQVRRLTEELAAARAEQMRAANRLREIEQRLHGVEARAELLDSLVAPKSPEQGAPEFELPADSMAPLAPEKPGLIYTETELGIQLSPAQPEAEAAEPLSLEDFEPRTARAAAEASALSVTSFELESPFDMPAPAAATAPVAGNDPVAESEPTLVDALSELFGEEPAKPKLGSEAPKEEIALDDLAGALEAWGSPESAPQPVDDEAPTAAKPEAPTLEDDDPFGGLASALESFGSSPAPEQEPVEAAVAEPEAETVETEETEVIETSVKAEAEATPEEEAPVAPSVPVEEAPAGGDLLEALGRVEAERRAQRPRAPQRERGAAVANALESWSEGEAEEANGGAETKPGAKGRAAMVDALLKFMGPQ